MTCEETRDLFSARADDALTAGERARLDTHLAACADCGREWQRFEATVGLLRAVEPARAPAGFVDRVLAARPRPWYRRIARGLFSPWPVKLPLEAAAVVLIAGLAVVILQRSSDLQQAARVPQAPPPVAEPAPTEGAYQTLGSERSAGARPAEERSRDGTTAPTGLMKDAAPSPAVQPPAVADRRMDEAERAVAKRAAGPPPAAVAPRPVEPEPSREAPVELHAKEALPPVSGRQGERDATRTVPAPAAPSSAGQKAARVERALPRMDARAGAADVEARLAAPDRAAAEREIRALVARLGGAVTPPGAASMEIDVPRAAWDELARELSRHGTLRIESQPTDLPPTVRLILRID